MFDNRNSIGLPYSTRVMFYSQHQKRANLVIEGSIGARKFFGDALR